jgi:uncharacterized repeat protein (TIGR03809 family)
MNPLPHKFSPEIARKWQELAERRRANLIDLYDTGRWRHYYSEGDFVSRMREAIGLSEEWARLADPQDIAQPAD